MEEINPEYRIIFEHGYYSLVGTEHSTNEHVKILAVAEDKISAEKLVNILNGNKVSIYHAIDVLRDKLTENAENLSCKISCSPKEKTL